MRIALAQVLIKVSVNIYSNVLKLFTAVKYLFTRVRNKLEPLSLARLFSLVWCLWVRHSIPKSGAPDRFLTRYGATTFSITTLSIKGLFVTLSINDIQRKRHSAYQKCHYAKCLYAKCCHFLIAILNVIMLSVVMLSVVMLSVVMLKVVAPTVWLQPIRLGLKGLQGSNTLAYYEYLWITDINFYNIGPFTCWDSSFIVIYGQRVYKLTDWFRLPRTND